MLDGMLGGDQMETLSLGFFFPLVSRFNSKGTFEPLGKEVIYFSSVNLFLDWELLF